MERMNIIELPVNSDYDREFWTPALLVLWDEWVNVTDTTLSEEPEPPEEQ